MRARFCQKRKDVCESWRHDLFVTERTWSHVTKNKSCSTNQPLMLFTVPQINLWWCFFDIVCERMKARVTQDCSKKIWCCGKSHNCKAKFFVHTKPNHQSWHPKQMRAIFVKELWINFVWRLFDWGQMGFENSRLCILQDFAFFLVSWRNTCLQVFFLF